MGVNKSGTGHGFTLLRDPPHEHLSMTDRVTGDTLAWAGPTSSTGTGFATRSSRYGNVSLRTFR